MNIIIVPGYGDRFDYIETATKNWQKKYANIARVAVFGWNGTGDSYAGKWEQFAEILQGTGKTAIIGISAGASVALRALHEHPDIVSKVVTICGPANPAFMDMQYLQRNYPVLVPSLESIRDVEQPGGKIMTLRPFHDGTIHLDAMRIPGATDKRIPMVGHTPSIVTAIFTSGGTINRFINEDNEATLLS